MNWSLVLLVLQTLIIAGTLYDVWLHHRIIAAQAEFAAVAEQHVAQHARLEQALDHRPGGEPMTDPSPDVEPRPGCHVCPDSVPRSPQEILNHLRITHPDLYGDGPERWPDGDLVVEDHTLTPDDFGNSP